MLEFKPITLEDRPLMEPFLMVFLGGSIGTVVIAMFMPIFNMGSLAH